MRDKMRRESGYDDALPGRGSPALDDNTAGRDAETARAVRGEAG